MPFHETVFSVLELRSKTFLSSSSFYLLDASHSLSSATASFQASILMPTVKVTDNTNKRKRRTYPLRATPYRTRQRRVESAKQQNTIYILLLKYLEILLSFILTFFF